ncbi:PAS domain-containing protein [Rhodoplanes roseus]|uniref:PAS domain-containing protein n=1 Tax=Rhodoplanes roseus TaxID=29409 RepID=A0A327LB51_9BRAD|nr:PAS domain-containing protein [Rhodoplanes roseus]RAI44968.1 hypothetical protein CH341_06345 [Rhodoplanes roseus]
MKHPSSRELFRYWTTLRGSRPAPDRDDLDPGALRKILGDSFILTFDSREGFPFRLAGTRMCGLFCRELKATPFVGLWDEESRALVRALLGGVAEEAAGIVAGASGITASEPPLPLELVLLPLAHRNSLHERLLGMLAPLQSPYWLGVDPVRAIQIGTFRNLTPRIAPSLVPASDPERRRARLVVLEGGRSR